VLQEAINAASVGWSAKKPIFITFKTQRVRSKDKKLFENIIDFQIVAASQQDPDIDEQTFPAPEVFGTLMIH
jgi:hypothetical protein